MNHRAQHIAATSLAPFHALHAVKVNADAYRKSAEIIELFPMARGLPVQALPFSDAARAMICAVFNGPSRNAVCEAAGRALGVSDDTILRILDRSTKKIEAELLFRCFGFYQARFGKPFDFGGVGIAFVQVRP